MIQRTVLCVLILKCLFEYGQVSGEKSPSAEKLIHDEILEGYNVDIRPEEAHGIPLHVHFDMKLQKVIEMDVKTQVFIVNTFIRMRWRDPQLAWNKTKYEGIDKINVGQHLIWTPDIVLYNVATESSFSHFDMYKTKALLFNDGTVIWTAPVTWRVSCSFDVTWFPIDKQRCSMTFGSWSYMKTQMVITVWDDISTAGSGIGHSEFMIKNGEWDISEVLIREKETTYSCCPHPFSNIVYTITLNRLTLYYFLYIVLPLVSQISLFFVIFHIPVESGERMGFGVTILLSITVYLLVISEKLPEKSDQLPMLGLCFISEFFILSVALVIVAIIGKLAIKTTKPPAILLHFCLGAKQCFEGPSAEDLVEAIPMRASSSYLHSEGEGLREDYMEKSPKRVSSNDEGPENDHNAKWLRICHQLDKLCFWTFGGASVIIPVIIVSSLDKSMLGV